MENLNKLFDQPDITIKKSVQEGGKTFINIYTPNIAVLNISQILTYTRKIDSNTTIIKTSNAPTYINK